MPCLETIADKTCFLQHKLIIWANKTYIKHIEYMQFYIANFNLLGIHYNHEWNLKMKMERVNLFLMHILSL